jgi:hypothetical protein
MRRRCILLLQGVNLHLEIADVAIPGSNSAPHVPELIAEVE